MINWIKNNRLLSIILVVSIGFFAYYSYDAIRWIPYPNSIDYGEGFVMNYAKLWANGSWSWDINTPPYFTMVYGVGFPVLATPFVNLFGAHLWVGRSISFIATIVVCLFVYLIVNYMTGKKTYALLACMIPATHPVFREWSFMARVDMIAVAFDIIGIYIAIRFKDSKYLYFAVIPFVCAFMVKQSVVVGAITVTIYLLIFYRKRIIPFIALYLMGLVAVFTPLMIVSGGTYWRHIFLYQTTIQSINIANAILLFTAFVYPFIVILILSLLYVRFGFSKKRVTIAGIYFVVALIINILVTLRPGAGCQFYFETLIAGSICVALVLPYIYMYIRRGKLETWGIKLALVLALVFTIGLPLRNNSFPDAQYTESVNDVTYIMSDSAKPIITENPAIALNMGKDLYIEYFIFANMHRLGYWDETPYLNNYKNQYFDYVLLRVSLEKRLDNITNGGIDGHFTDDILLAINNNYTLVYETINRTWPYSVYLYESNEKLQNDDRMIIQNFINNEKVWR